MAVSEILRKIRLVRIAHVYYKHKDLETQVQFLKDFGFSECKRVGNKIYFRGYGDEPFVYCTEEGSEDEFGGAAFVTESEEDLEYAARTLPNATPIYELVDAPGGGKCVTFRDPVDDFPFHLVWGQSPAPLDNSPEFPDLIQRFNFPNSKNRDTNRTQRVEKRPAPIHKLGHFGIAVTNFEKTFDFYTTRFNFFPSELIHDPNTGRHVTAFNRLERGKELVDHHCFFFFEGSKFHVHHSSFETHDFDTQLLGHDWLRQKGYENCWGVGRHIMGSQIFDYWQVAKLQEEFRVRYANITRFDPSRFILEHYVDGDLLDDQDPTNFGPASLDNLHVWGPDLPPTFLS